MLIRLNLGQIETLFFPKLAKKKHEEYIKSINHLCIPVGAVVGTVEGGKVGASVGEVVGTSGGCSVGETDTKKGRKQSI